MIRLIEIRRPQGSPKNSVTIVFDGSAGRWAQPASPSVRVVFSLDQSADDEIKKMVMGSSAKKRTVVVTNDNDIRFFVRHLGARTISVKDFLGPVTGFWGPKGASSPKKGPGEGEEKYISKTLEYKITSEMEKIWVNPSKSPKDQRGPRDKR